MNESAASPQLITTVPRGQVHLWCRIIIIFGRFPFGRCHILHIFSKIFYYIVQKLISLKFRHLFFELFLAELDLGIWYNSMIV
jgi:hypothetical protein